MNIFVLDYSPIKAAQMQCDKHVVKMPLETAQLLCSAFHRGIAPYKPTHHNHPCSLWTKASEKNYLWLIEHGLALCSEYTYRYNKIHKSQDVILWCKDNRRKISFPQKRKTHFVLCFDKKYHIGNAVESYRFYYRKSKYDIAQWNRTRSKPQWFY